MFGIMIIWDYWILEFYHCGVCYSLLASIRRCAKNLPN